MHAPMLVGAAGLLRAASRLTRKLPSLACSKLVCALLACCLSGGASAASNVVQYTYDANGNIVSIQRQAAGSVSITGFDPASGAVGTPVTIYGSGFYPGPANNLVKFNGITARVSAATPTSISTSVPAGATTGSVSITVGAVTATSSTSFVVLSSSAPTITSFTPWSGIAGDSISVVGTNFDASAGGTSVSLNGVATTASASSATTLSFVVPAGAASGRVAASTSAGSGQSAIDFIVAPPGMAATDIAAAVRIAPNGPMGNLTVTTPGASGLALFDGAASGYYSLQLSNLTTSPMNVAVDYKVINPDNSILLTGTLRTSTSPSIHLPPLPASGTYSLVLSPGTATLDVDVRVEANPVLTVDGSALGTSLDYAGQSARFVFDATAGQHVDVGLTGLAYTPANASGFLSNLHVYQPSGAEITINTLCGVSLSNPQGNCDTEITAPVAGTYTVVVANSTAAIGNGALQLSSEVTGALFADAGQEVTLSRVGQDGRFTFAANAGDSRAIDLSAYASLPQVQSVSAEIYMPDGTSLTTCNMRPPGPIYCELGSLPTTGNYTLYLDPDYGSYGSFVLTLKQGATLGISDAPLAFAPENVPETARFTFSGTAGQDVSVAVTGLAYTGTSGSPTTLTVYRPDRSSLRSSTCRTADGGTCRVRLANLPLTGTYSIALSPPAGVKITGSASISQDLVGSLAAGVTQAIDVERPGQSARFTFSGASGDAVSLELFDVTTSPSGQSLNVTVYKPDGSTLTSGSGSATSPLVLNLSLPANGTYTALVEPAYGATWQAQLELDAGLATGIDSSPVTLPTGVAGQPFRFTFPGTAGQPLDFGLSGLAYDVSSSASTSVKIYRPDGNSIATISCPGTTGSCDRSIASLPATGMYFVIVQPPASNYFTGGTMALSTPLAGTFVIGDPAQTVALTRPGQTARYTFAGSPAQLLRLNWSSVSVSSSYVSVSVLKPDGSILSSSTFSNGATGGLAIASLPVSGNYTVLLDPNSAATMSAAISLVPR